MSKKSGISRTASGVSALLEANRQRREEQQSAEVASNAGDSPAIRDAKSGTGQIFARRENSLQIQVLELQRQLEESGSQSIATDKVSPSRYYNRFELDLDPNADRDFAELLSGIKADGGNAVPALLHKNDDDSYELIYGHRRWAACKQAGVPLVAYVKEGLDAREVARLQLLENTGRKDPSVLDRALQVVSQLKKGAWKGGQSELAKTMGISQGYVSMLHDIGQNIPMTVQMAHPNHHKITFKQIKRIADIAKESPATLNTRIEWVRTNKPSLSSEEATNYLIHGKQTVSSDGPSVQWSASKQGMTLKVRGLTSATAVKLSARVEELMVEFGLAKAASDK